MDKRISKSPLSFRAKESIIKPIRETNKLKLKLEKLSGLPDGRFNLDTNSWKRGKCIGSGSFGTVYQGLTKNGDLVAVKEVFFLDQGNQQGKQSIDKLEWEISVLSRLQHGNIVQYLGTETDNSKLYIFLEFVHISLASIYQNFNLGDSQVSAYTRQILSGLSYLHSQNVGHLDIKCANILVDFNGSVKLADFGLAKVIRQIGNYSKMSKYLFWMAPEVIKINSLDIGLAADIWSLGCTVLEMLTRQVPYFPLQGIQVLYRIGRGELPDIPDSISEDARDFILKCLQMNPDDRPSADQLSNHAFVKRPESAVTFPTHSTSSS